MLPKSPNDSKSGDCSSCYCQSTRGTAVGWAICQVPPHPRKTVDVPNVPRCSLKGDEGSCSVIFWGFSAASNCSSFSSSAPEFSEFVGSQPLCNERVARDVGIVFSLARRWRHLANCSTHRGSSSRFANGTNCNLHSLRHWGFSCEVFQRT